MRVLLDESLPRKLKAELGQHEVTTVPEAGWAGTKNGDLLRSRGRSFTSGLEGLRWGSLELGPAVVIQATPKWLAPRWASFATSA
jgi:hypothetical protein